MKKPQIIIEQIQSLAQKYEKEHETRKGQSLMNALFEIWPEKGREITLTIADCFFDDKKIVHFWEAIGRDLE